jgi:hypothetical protein
MAVLKLSLSNGREVAVSSVTLYPQHLLIQAIAMKTEALKKLGGVSSGLGLWGSPGWVIAGSLALGAIESALSKQSQNEGAGLVAEADQKFSDARRHGVAVSVEAISGVASPNVQEWRADSTHTRAVALRGLTPWQLEQLCAQCQVATNDVFSVSMLGNVRLLREELNVPEVIPYIHDGGEFIKVLSDRGEEHIRWSDVSTYEYVGSETNPNRNSGSWRSTKRTHISRRVSLG